MAVTIESTSTDGPNFSKPSGLSEGDLMLALLFKAGSESSPNPPSGFSQLESLEDSKQQGTSYIYKKKATSSDENASSFDFGAGNNGQKGALYRISGAATSEVKSVMKEDQEKGPISTSITPRHTSSVLVASFGQSNGNGYTYTLDPSTVSITTNGSSPSFSETFDNGESEDSFAVADATYADTDTITELDADWGDTGNTSGYEIFGLVVVEKPNDSSGTSSLVEATKSIFNVTGSNGTKASPNILVETTNIFTQSGTATQPTQWQNESGSSTNWTNEN